MTLTVVSLGGPVTEGAEALLRDAGIRSFATGAYPKKEETLALLAERQPDAIVVRLVERIDEDILRASQRLKVVAKHGAGTNDIDVAAAARLGLPVLAAVGANARSVAEHALALMLALAKDVRRQDAFVRGGGWAAKIYTGFELHGRRLGLVGMGEIGRRLAAMVQPLGMTVAAHDPFAPDGAFGPDIARAADLPSLLAGSDVVSLHCPLTPQTRNLIGAPELRLMKPTALLINTARGEVVDEPALVEALRGGVIAGAGLDCFSPEPPAADNPLWGLDNVILSPHIGGVTEDARREVSLRTVRNVIALLSGQDVDRHFFVHP
ncbi:hydroxyacid dehydrogenase [Azospirillum sp. RWY-5-1]|uniref:Hydroxyacid dehydrogenase n=1 Tax=Azospirillum oleiclasticum TaxID=2735135 RepID=A0ABX2TJP5_9PROT|nr:hydroxyacid dehydrogenase [Azospirillum oleiclasticum]NYZ14349.1 hydroxyacid dehydrogenase [Azospirillum oleiclasticum]NYZ23299.1 hydroxyacid dehydrogenase [Azospirillum oleiclasticum]